LLVVWEPILATDWRAPSWSALRRIPDTRAKQIWDPNRLVAQELNRTAMKEPGKTKPACCMERGFYWDEAIVYGPHAKWEDEAKPAFLNGPVVRIASGLEGALGAQN
jgi:hypothetical protein